MPYIWFGTLMQFGGLALLPFALLVMTGGGDGPAIVGQIGAALAFLLVGAGMHTTQTAGLALATDLAPEEARPRVVALLYVMLLVGMMVSAIVIGRLLADFTPTKLVQIVQGAAVLTMVLNIVALWKQEARNRAATAGDAPRAGVPRRLGGVHRAAADDAAARRGRAGRGGIQHAGRPARALWRPDPRPVGRRDDLADRAVGGRACSPASPMRRGGWATAADPHRLAGFGGVAGIARVPVRDLRRAAAFARAARHRRDADRLRRAGCSRSAR